ncbi:hypothetical protein RhiXN_02532 [Rhizoctonia solani]|uniref:Uncharacterized protein n=1 Tax=Rhizoctonia solani TaxID=456999 RepID=A0A8H8SUZ3_9AGAM|nr:uncharacterized protein RhiXN_02532 [Rhizoctonia solani]QRW17608.1 hypothetical protein RhiXN_02532 [Rhizoctonia solani]
MSSQNISTQPTAAPVMQMNIEPESGKQTQTRFQSLRLRGGGAAKGCLIGALSCFICCEAAAIASPQFYAAHARYSAVTTTNF